MTPLLSVRDLRTYFHTDEGTVRAVDGVSFDVRVGETVAIVGESGSRKTVTAESLTRIFLSPSGEIVGGEVIFEGVNLTELSESEPREYRGSRIPHVFQNPQGAPNPVYTVGWQLRESVNLHRDVTGEEEADQISAELLNSVGIPDPEATLERYPHEPSGGQKQRVLIAAALAGRPDLLVADEPTTALDVSTQADVLSLFDDLCEEFGLTVVVISHDISVVERICDRVGVMYVREMVEKGREDDVLSEPAHPYTRALLASVPEPDPSSEPPSTSLKGDVPDPANPPSGCRFHPRCPEALLLDEYNLERDEREAVMRFRERLRKGPDAVLESVSSDRKPVRDELGLPTAEDRRADEVLDGVVDTLVDGEVEEAQEPLRVEFGTPCEREKPDEYDVGDEHTATCLFHDERFDDG